MMNSGWAPLAKIQTPIYQQNLRFLAAFHPVLHQQIHTEESYTPLEVKTVRQIVCCRTADEPHEYLLGEHHPQEEAAKMQARLKQSLKPRQLTVIPGAMGGFTLLGVLPFLLHHPDFRAVWIEPSASRMAAALRFVDIRAALQTGRFHLAIAGVDEASLFQVIQDFQLWNQPELTLLLPINTPAQQWHQNFLNEYFSRSRRHNERVCMLLESFSQKRSSHPDTVSRVLLVDCWPKSVQRIHLLSIEKALTHRGIETHRIQLDGYRYDLFGNEYRRLVEWDVLSACDELQPDLILSYAYHAPHWIQAQRFAALDVPWLQVVSNLVFQDHGYYPHEYTALCETKLLPLYQKRGAENVFVVPLMANVCVDEVPQTDHTLPIVFVGNSLGLHPQETQAFLSRIKPNDRLYRYLLQAEQEIGVPNPSLNLFDFIESNPIPETRTEEEWHAVFRYLLCQTTHRRRRELLESIADLGLHVYGNWKDRLPMDSPLHACLKGYLPFNEEPSLYHRASVFVNIHSTGNASCPNMRFFNTAGGGGMQITDGAFGSFLQEEVEAVYYQSVDEFREKIIDCLHHPQEAQTLRRHALQRIKQQWTYKHWLDAVSRHLPFHFCSS